jgi:hypothetical protein
LSQGDNQARGQAWDLIEERSIDGKEVPEFSGHGESDVLPGGLGEGVPGGFNPVVGGFFATGRTEPGFAGVRDFFGGKTFGAGKQMKAEKRGSADQEFEDIDDNADSDQVSMLEEQFPPVAVIQEDGSQFYSGYEFHRSKDNQPMKISKIKLPRLAA